MTDAREQVVEKARNVVAGYAASRGHWNPASSLSTLLRQMQREYEDRFEVEPTLRPLRAAREPLRPQRG